MSGDAQFVEPISRGMDNIAEMIGGYYKALTKVGLPVELVQALVMDYGRIVWATIGEQTGGGK